MSAGKFSVCQFFEGDTYEYVRRFVGAEEAVQAARHYTDNVAAKMGITKRVIITDGGDHCVFEWLAGKGVVYPTRASRCLRAASAPDWTDVGYFSVGSNAINESITPSALVCHLSHTKWLVDSKLVAPWAAVSSSAP